jgi:sensor domain CHASE-containing protein
MVPGEPGRCLRENKPPNAAYQPRRALRAVGWMRLFGGLATSEI